LIIPGLKKKGIWSAYQALSRMPLALSQLHKFAVRDRRHATPQSPSAFSLDKKFRWGLSKNFSHKCPKLSRKFHYRAGSSLQPLGQGQPKFFPDPQEMC
jgi:hypothetical protein